MYTLIFLFLYKFSQAHFFPGLSLQGQPYIFPGRWRNHDGKLSLKTAGVPLFQGTRTLGCSLLFPTYPTPHATLKGTGLCLRSKGERNPPPPPPPPPLQPYLPSPNPVPHSLRSIVKTQPPLFPWPGLLKQRALHEKKRLVFKCCAVKGGLFQVGAEICSDSRVPLLFF